MWEKGYADPLPVDHLHQRDHCGRALHNWGMDMIQLPNDAQSVGFKQVRPFHFEQVFCSDLVGFTGTEREFVQAGHAYQYAQVDKFTRVKVSA